MYNVEARVEMKGQNFEPIGDSTEVGLLKFLQDAEVPVHKLMKYKYLKRKVSIPFQSFKRRSITAVDLGEVVRFYIKGAPEEVISKCSGVGDIRGFNSMVN